MNLDDAVATIRASGLADRADRILPHLKPGLRIRATRAPDAGMALVSRFAGHGVLPRGTPWPQWDSSRLHRRWVEYSRKAAKQPGASKKFWDEQIASYEAQARDNPKPLNFVAMVRLRDIARDASTVGLPDAGTLLFFYDVERMQGSFWPEARGGWRILFVQDDSDLVVVDRPPIHVDEFVPSTLTFELQYSLPEDLRTETGDEDLRVYRNEEYQRVHDALRGVQPDQDAVIHQLGGVPLEVQSGLFLECQLASNGLDCGAPEDLDLPRARELARDAGRWRLLLQIDSDEEGPGWMWGDVGRLYYCVHEDDLRDRRFDRSWCVEQCS